MFFVYTGTMPAARRKPDPVKNLIKSAITEMVEDNHKLLRKLFEEIIEDAIMTRAIKDCPPKKKVSREKVFKTLLQLSK